MPPALSRPVRRIRLRVERRPAKNPCRFLDGPGGSVRELPLLRLVTTARVYPATGPAGSLERADALIDTGSWLSALRPDVWRSYLGRGLIEELAFADGATERPAQIAGLETPYRLGRLHVGLLELLGPAVRPAGGPLFHELPAVPVIAQLFLDPKLDSTRMPSRFILGLYAGVLDGRRLSREVLPPLATGLETDAGPTFGQDWFLESP